MIRIIVDKDIYLKLLNVEHTEDLFELIDKNRKSLRKWLPWVDTTRGVEDTRKFIYSSIGQYSRNDGFHAGIWYKDILVGVIGLHMIDHNNRYTSIGYWLDEEFQGKGIMTKACDALIRYIFNELKLNRVEIRCAEENIKSKAIPERLGFVKEGILRETEFLYDHYVNHVVYGLLRDEWNKEQISKG